MNSLHYLLHVLNACLLSLYLVDCYHLFDLSVMNIKHGGFSAFPPFRSALQCSVANDASPRSIFVNNRLQTSIFKTYKLQRPEKLVLSSSKSPQEIHITSTEIPFFPLSELRLLEIGLSESVRDERYNDAANIRDKIRSLRSQDEITRLRLELEDCLAGSVWTFVTVSLHICRIMPPPTY